MNTKLNLVDKNQKITPGLIDASVEFFLHDNEVLCITNGQTYAFSNFPTRVKNIVNEDMVKNTIAVDSLIDWGFEDLDSQMRQYISCRHGGHDTNADIDVDGNIQPSEYVNCGRRGVCPYEGKICTSIELGNGILTRSEVAVLMQIGLGLLDKEIADLLNISEHTIRHHKDSIARKSGLDRKPALVGLAYQLGLIG
jgi:DNA-binding CsgD family transcriptional regulator